MKFSDCIRMAFLNLKSYKKITVFICLSMLLALCMVISAFTYNNAIASSLDSKVSGKSSNMYFSYSTEQPLYSDIDNLSKVKALNGMTDIKIEKIFGWFDIIERCFGEGSGYAFEMSDFGIENATLVVDGKKHQGVNDHSYGQFCTEEELENGFFDDSVFFSMSQLYIDKGYVQFAKAETNEYYQKHTEDFLIGSEMKNDNDIIMSEYILSKFGFSLEDAQKLIGKKITLKFTLQGQTFDIVKDYTLCGILRTDFYDVEEFRTENHIFIPLNKDSVSQYYAFEQQIFFDSFSSAYKAYKTLSQDETVWVTASESLSIYSEIEKQQTLYTRIVLLVLILIVFAVLVFMISSIQYYFNKRLRFILLERAIGMRSGKVFSVFIMEFLICGIVSLIVTVPISYFMITELMNFMQGYIGGAVTIFAGDFMVGVMFGIVFVLVLSLIFTVIQFFKVQKQNIVSVIAE
ncbi:MAG: ABC transporter permease [Acutalibacteraceae bacterium]